MTILQFANSLFLILLDFLNPIDVGFEGGDGRGARDQAGDQGDDQGFD
ncbi:hypothetical protein [Vibrio neptunius]|nr:hypothetical protein [Vibrio neptunius]